MRKVFRFTLVSLGVLICAVLTAWAAGALYFDLPIAWLRIPLAAAYAVAMLSTLFFFKGRWLGMSVAAAGFAVGRARGSLTMPEFGT